MRYQPSVELIESLKRHEGVVLRTYLDSEGIPTIGIGTNLMNLEIDKKTAVAWCKRDLRVKRAKLDQIPSFEGLDEVRKDVLTEAAYQLGVAGLMKFSKMWAAIERRDFWAAASEMLDSKVAREQAPRRWRRLAARMREGRWDPKEEV